MAHQCDVNKVTDKQASPCYLDNQFQLKDMYTSYGTTKSIRESLAAKEYSPINKVN